MFQQVRTNNPIYLLDKGENPTLMVGIVESVSNPAPRYATTFQVPSYQEMVVDIVAKFGDERRELKQLPANMTIANTGANGVVVSTDVSAMTSEIEGFMKSSQSIIDSVEYHKKVVESCSEMIARLNPQIAKDRANDERLSSLETQMSDLSKNIEKIVNMLGEHN